MSVDYAALLSQEHRKPMLTAWVQVLTEAMNANATILASLPSKFDVQVAVGEQLDFTGEWIGTTRVLDLPASDGYFSWDTANRGWDQAPWFFASSPILVPYTLDDDHYRMLLFAKIADNMWDGSIPSAYAVWNQFYPNGVPYQFFIQDRENMEAVQGLVGITTPVTPDAIALLRSGRLGLDPVGVNVKYAYIPDVAAPMFAFDLDTPFFKGWGRGQWATII